ncbi:MAG: hypothetical protein R3C53_09790 [Pirellulaceae bacterium]
MSLWSKSIAIGWLWLYLVCLPVLAQRSDSFEGGDPRWQLVESDCNAELTEHEISLLMPHGGRTCEMFEVACTNGRFVLLAYPIEPCAIIDEFQPRLWTRCSSGRIQLGVRVVFPQAEHPITGGRLNSILWGDLYADTGQWQMLEVTKLQRLLQEEVVSLRQRFGRQLNLDGAIIDSLVINAYTGPGRYRVQIDDLDLRGMIPMASLGIAPPENWRERWQWRQATPTAEERFWAAANRPPVWLQYQGESLPWLHSLGFTGLLLNQLPSEPILARINDAHLAVISPPPAHPLTIKPEIAPVIRGWLVGAALDSRQAEVVQQQSARVARMPSELHRPLVGEALEHYWQFSRLADEVIIPAPSPHAADTLRDKQQWLAHNLVITRQRGNGWVSLSVGESPSIREQYRAARMAIEPTSITPQNIGLLADFGPEAVSSERMPTNPLGLRLQTASAILAGAKGILYRTLEPLDLQSIDGSADIASLRWTIADLNTWGPWIVAGRSASAPGLSRGDYVAGAWNVVDSDLILAHTMAEGSQFCVPPTRQAPLQMTYRSSASNPQVFRITRGSLERVELTPATGSLQWTAEDPAPVEAFVVTSNPSVLNFVRRMLATSATQNASDQLEIAAYNLAIAADVTDARFSPRDDSAIGREARASQLRQLARLQQQLDAGWQALRSGEPLQATELAFQASDGVQAILYDAQRTAVSNLASPQASAFVLSPALLKYHWKLAEACERSQWQHLPLPGAELTNLDELISSGWSQQRRLEEQVDLRVEVVPAGYERKGGLRLAAYQKTDDAQPMPGGYEGASLRVRSAAVPVQAGQLIRVSASARVLKATSHPASGLLIYDNQCGPSLGQLVRGAVGDRIPVELYRFATDDGEFRLLAECRGECDIVLESISASVIQPATNRRSFTTSTLGNVPATIIGEVYGDE